MKTSIFNALALFFLIASGASAEVNEAAIRSGRPTKLLSELGFFENLKTQEISASLTAYEIASPLFTDYAEKYRYLYFPENAEPMAYSAESPLPDFPVGSALIKTFGYTRDGIYQPVETRVLMHSEEGWIGYPYIWKSDLSDAELKVAGKDIPMEIDGPDGEKLTFTYHVPNYNQCRGCHIAVDGKTAPIGPKFRNLNINIADKNQLLTWQELGILSALPDINDIPATPRYKDETVAIEDRARAYLDANCGHCHATGLPAESSALFLNWEEERPLHRGIMKPPVAAGRGSGDFAYDIVPGKPDESILLYRMDSIDPGVMMPELGRGLIDANGVELIRAYIEGIQ